MATEEVMIDYDMQNPKKKKSKPKTSVMKKLGKTAGEAVHELPHKTGMNFDEKSFKGVKPLKEMKMADEISDDKEWSKKYKANSEQQKDSYKGLRDAMLKQSAPMEKMISMPIMESKETPMDKKKSKLESLKKPATKKN